MTRTSTNAVNSQTCLLKPRQSSMYHIELNESHLKEALQILVPKLRQVGWMGPSGHRPKLAIVCGSGLGQLVDSLDSVALSIPYAEIPHFCPSTVAGHVGVLTFGMIQNLPVVIMVGRLHYYEGYSFSQVTFPIKLMALLGLRSVLMTNAAGGLNTNYKKGDLMIVSDHINYAGMAGSTPLKGPLMNVEKLNALMAWSLTNQETELDLDNHDSVRQVIQSVPQKQITMPRELARFPSLNDAYSKSLQSILLKACLSSSYSISSVHSGVYVYLSGPAYETPAEVKFLRMMGADAVGMSTIPEVLAARQLNLEVLAFSLISNEIVPDRRHPDIQDLLNEENVQVMGLNDKTEGPTHEEVIAATKQSSMKLTNMIRTFVETLSGHWQKETK